MQEIKDINSAYKTIGALLVQKRMLTDEIRGLNISISNIPENIFQGKNEKELLEAVIMHADDCADTLYEIKKTCAERLTVIESDKGGK